MVITSHMCNCNKQTTLSMSSSHIAKTQKTLINIMLELRVVVMVTILLVSPSVSIHFNMESGQTKCIAEDIMADSMTVGKYSIVNLYGGLPLPDSHKITVRVTSDRGNNEHYAEKVESGQFAFTAMESGDYVACFSVPEDPSSHARFPVDFDWRTGIAANHWSAVAKKGKVDVLEFELKKLFDDVTDIHEEMFHLRMREEEMLKLSQATTSRMAWMSFLSLIIALSVAALQLWHLKNFFQKKKLI